MNIFNISERGLTELFIILVVFFMGITIVGGHLYPLIVSMNPNATIGVTGDVYLDKTDNFIFGLRLGILILVVALFLYVALKILYEKEGTSVYNGG